MEQFNLDTWLKDKSRKVVTRRGNPVRIICIDRKHGEDTLPIVFLEESPDGIGEFLLSCRANGTCDNYDTPYDLFFADEKEELTEFEKVLKEVIEDVQNGDYIEEESFDFWKDRLLDLAKKELERSNVIVDKDKYIKNCDYYYEQGKQDALKSLPKWKKAKEDRILSEDWVVKFNKDGKIIFSDVVHKGEYFIILQSLETLPKE